MAKARAAKNPPAAGDRAKPDDAASPGGAVSHATAQTKKRETSQTADGTETLRRNLAQTDAELIQLLHQRAKLALALARQGNARAVAAAEAALDQAATTQRGALPEPAMRAVLHELQSGCRALIREPRVAFLGPLYSYSHLAALRQFGQGVEQVPVATIAAVFEEVHKGHSDFGLAPIENSTDGRVADSLDMFTRVPVKISAMVEMRIHHMLLGACPRSEVKEVYSKAQPLSQCRNWLAKHLPGARTIEVTSTTTAAQLAKEKSGAAAIASRQAGVHYGLDVLAENIEDAGDNVTRFAVIGPVAAPRSGDDRTALLFQVEHRPGTLAEAMNIFKRAQVNLTWIESFPIPNSQRAYLFFVEAEGHPSDARVRRALRNLEKKALRLEVLGSFPKPILLE